MLFDIHIELRFLISKAVLKSPPHKNNIAEYRIKSIFLMRENENISVKTLLLI